MARLSALDVVILLLLLALIVFVGTKEFPRYHGRSIAVPSPTSADQAS